VRNTRSHGYRSLCFLLSACILTWISGIVTARGGTGIRDTIPHDTLRRYRQTEQFYDSVYQKFQRKKLGRLIYPVAFRSPVPPNPDPGKTVKSEAPYEPYAGKVIRNILIRTKPPFGNNVYDTLLRPGSSTGKWLNGIHIKTQNYVIRDELLFHPGDRVDPVVMADNERTIRDLAAIDNVAFYLRETSPGSDTVDVEVITKDVWSIWGNLISISSEEARFSLYDANFLGLNDKLNLTFSADRVRAPFFLWEGVDYLYTNIAGTFINAFSGFNWGSDGKQVFRAGLDRSFVSVETRWAGTLSFTNAIQIQDKSDTLSIRSRYDESFAWLGVSYPIVKSRESTRFVLAESYLSRIYVTRPEVNSQSDPLYFNRYQFLTGFCFYRNKYYTAYYVGEFGRPENIPYGHNVQLTIGPDLSEFTTRMYTGLTVSGGNLLDNSGYMRVTTGISGFIGRGTFEDGIVKAGVSYFSSLYTTYDNRFKFRAYLDMRYVYGFHLNLDRLDHYNLNNLFRLPFLRNDSALYGQHSLGMHLSLQTFTPWYFYGFKFALVAFGDLGYVTKYATPVSRGQMYGGFGFGVKIKNDNLVFPPVLISFAFYPGNQPGVSPLQFEMNSDPFVVIPNFIAVAPHEETLLN
jgi:hypothetical protein